ncbi:hypothetical protein CEE37_01835 [candidate division LCP-89 bacterium B3_LCP]|uniref:Cell division protein ZapA n=1 Tax=candidate division LCP-89 bacterium B3_LCP TaxID=2012998 RepID=A0A532V657_UNCL8|nr:MAG: hypothetical protein CEE37_01835 [candidate division LCP-89 bacterium B3_LCP]
MELTIIFLGIPLPTEPKTPVRIKILDIEYTVTGYDDEEYLKEVAEIVDKRMKLLLQMRSDIPPLKNAILTALNIADELLRTRKQLSNYEDQTANFYRKVADRSKELAELCSQI